MQFTQLQKPEDKFRSILLECLERAILDDAKDNRKGFNKNMKHFLRLLSPRMKKEMRDEITAKETAMIAKLAIDTSGKTKDDIEAATTKAEYEFYDSQETVGVNTLFNTGMFPKETGATLKVGKTMESLNKVGEAVRSDKDIEEVEEDGDYAFSEDNL